MANVSTVVLVLTLLRRLWTCFHMNVKFLFDSAEEQKCQNALQRSLLLLAVVTVGLPEPGSN